MYCLDTGFYEYSGVEIKAHVDNIKHLPLLILLSDIVYYVYFVFGIDSKPENKREKKYVSKVMFDGKVKKVASEECVATPWYA